MAETGCALVTGAAGFLGSHLVRSLVADGWAVHALVRPGGKMSRIAGLAGQAGILNADITDYPALLDIVRTVQPDTIYHLAGDTSVRRFEGEWETVDRAIAVNLSGTLNVVRAAAESGAPVRGLVRTGGLEEYGTGPAPAGEAQREQPSSPYSASQTSATHWCQMLQPQVGFAIVNLRPALVYGPEQGEDFLMPSLIRSLLSNERFAISDGMQVRDYIFIDDAVRAFRLAADRAASLRGAVINIASGNQYRVADVARTIARRLDKEHLLDIGGVPPRAGDLPNVSGVNVLAGRLLGWHPEVALDEGLARTIAWSESRTDAQA